jgi:nucleoid DNA-binding protein
MGRRSVRRPRGGHKNLFGSEANHARIAALAGLIVPLRLAALEGTNPARGRPLTPRGDIMNKSEMIDAIATRSELSKAASAKALDAVIETIVDTVAQGDTVTLVGFGSFKASERASREGKNPKTGAKILIPQTIVPKFAAGATFKARVAGKDE